MLQPNVVFIHGLWIHSTSWGPWIELFNERGYTSTAPGWPGESRTVAATREAPDAMRNVGIEAIVRHYADILAAMPSKPIVIGHAFGGLIAQELLSTGAALACVAIDPVPIKGVRIVPFSQLRAAFPVLANPANRHRTVSLTARQFKFGFANAIGDDESDRLFDRWTIPGPGRPLFEDATANFHPNSPAAVDTHAEQRGPLLLTSGTNDHVVPESVTDAVYRRYENGSSSVTDYQEFAGKGHSLTLDAGWRDVAESILEWLGRQHLDTPERDASVSRAHRTALSTSFPGDR